MQMIGKMFSHTPVLTCSPLSRGLRRTRVVQEALIFWLNYYLKGKDFTDYCHKSNWWVDMYVRDLSVYESATEISDMSVSELVPASEVRTLPLSVSVHLLSEPSSLHLFLFLSDSVPEIPVFRIGLTERRISTEWWADVLSISSYGHDVRDISSENRFRKVPFSENRATDLSIFDRPDRKTEVKRRKSVVTHPFWLYVLSVGRSDGVSMSNPMNHSLVFDDQSFSLYGITYTLIRQFGL